MRVPRKYAGWLAGVAVVLVGVGCTETPTTLDQESDRAVDQLRQRFNDVDFVESPSLGEGLLYSHTGVPLHAIDIAGVGVNDGNLAAAQAVTLGDVTGTFSTLSKNAFNGLTPAQLRTAYDVLIFTWISDPAINADWATRLLPYLELGGGILFEDPNNVGDLAAVVTTSIIEESGGITVSSAVPGLTDGIVNSFVNNHIKFTSPDPALSPFLMRGSDVVGLWGPFGSGCIVLTGPDQHYHGDKTGAFESQGAVAVNQYNFLVNELHFVTHGCAQTIIPPGGGTATFEDSTVGVSIPPETFDDPVIVTGEFVEDCHVYLIAQIGKCLKLEFLELDGVTPAVIPANNEIVIGLCFEEGEFTGPKGEAFTIFGFAGNPPNQGLPSTQPVDIAEEVDAPFLDCSGFIFASATSTNPIVRFASGALNHVKQWFAPKPLMASFMMRDAGFGRRTGSPFFVWAERAISIQPTINCKAKGNGVIPVALLSVDLNENGVVDPVNDPGDFDATLADAGTVRFRAQPGLAADVEGGASETHKKKGMTKRHEEDVNGDGFTDLMFHFRQKDVGLACGDTYARLTGQLMDPAPGEFFETADFLRMTGN